MRWVTIIFYLIGIIIFSLLVGMIVARTGAANVQGGFQVDAQLVTVQLPPLLVWSSSIFALALVGMGIRQEMIASKVLVLLTKLSDLKMVVDKVKTMHDHPDDYGFGTRQTNELLKSTARVLAENANRAKDIHTAIENLVHVIKHDFEQRTGTTIPPRMPKI